MSTPAYGPMTGVIDNFRRIPEEVDQAVSRVPGASRFAQFFFPQQQQGPQDTSWHDQMVAQANDSHRQAQALQAAQMFRQMQQAKNQRAQAQSNTGE